MGGLRAVQVGAQHEDLSLRPCPGGPNLNPEWTSFWTLDEQRGGPPTCTADDVESAYDGLEVIAADRATGTVPIGWQTVSHIRA